MIGEKKKMSGRIRWVGMEKNSMRLRLLIVFLAEISLLTLLVSGIGYRAFEKTLVEEMGSNRADVLRQIGERVRLVKDRIYTVSNLYYYDETLREYLEEIGTEGDGEREQQIRAYMDQLTWQYKNSFYEEGQGFQVVLALESGGGYTSKKLSDENSYDYMSPKTKVWYKRMLFAQGGMIDIAHYQEKADGKAYFSVVRCINNRQGKTAAYLMINVEETQIYKMYQFLVKTNENVIYVVDQTGTIISSSNRNLNGFEFFHMKNLDRLFDGKSHIFTKMRGIDILFTRYYDSNSGFTILEEIPVKNLMEPINQVRIFIICLALIAMTAATCYAVYFTDRVTKPLSQLCEFMVQVKEDNMNQECEVQGYTEINILSSRLNLMLHRIWELVQGIKQNERQKRKLELSFLQAQINPHFMYNTLFSIKCMVDMEKNEEASKMLTSFIQLLKSTLSNPDEYVKIRHEFEMLKQYVDIQQFRYDNHFQVLFESDEKVAEKKIPKLLIQPLLENAIFHGIEQKQGDGLVILTARQIRDTVVVTIEDNGQGMEPDIIKKIEHGEMVSEKIHIGIGNVKERIQLNFGENYGVRIESVPGKGTRIILTFPVID